MQFVGQSGLIQFAGGREEFDIFPCNRCVFKLKISMVLLFDKNFKNKAEFWKPGVIKSYYWHHVFSSLAKLAAVFSSSLETLAFVK